MKLILKKKKNKLVKVEDSECHNCKHPFFGNEKFCPECGQANKNPKITFGNFVHEVFNGFISWDSKFWTTFIPLLTKPGKVSRDYIDGKRQRYANPFRFYLTISVLFFLIIGATESYDTFKELRTGKTESEKSINDQIDDATKKSDSVTIDSLLNAALQKADSIERAELLKTSPIINFDSTKNNSNILASISILKWSKFSVFNKEHPTIETDVALDSLGLEKTFGNRFSYTRLKAFSSIINNNGESKEFSKQLISYVSISLFIFLPLFTFFLKLFYRRRKFTYVEHLVFVFHTQTVFFLLLTIFYIIDYIKHPQYSIGLFLALFLVYLYLAMKRFYKQGHLKTFIKFILVNVVFFFISAIGSVLVTLIAFAFY